MNKTVTLIVPCYNEEESLPIFYRAVCDVARGLPQYQISLLFVNDGSKDGTLNVMRNLAAQDERVKYLSFSRNFGKEAAMYAGFCNAKCLRFWKQGNMTALQQGALPAMANRRSVLSLRGCFIR